MVASIWMLLVGRVVPDGPKGPADASDADVGFHVRGGQDAWPVPERSRAEARPQRRSGLRGVVRSLHGRASGASVTVNWLDAEFLSLAPATVQCDEKGRFSVPLPTDARIVGAEVVARHVALGIGREQVFGFPRDVTIKLRRPNAILGRLEPPPGRRVNFDLYPVYAGAQVLLPAVRLANAHSEEQGAFVLEVLESGDFVLSIRSADFARVFMPVTIERGTRLDVGTIRTVPSGQLVGVVESRFGPVSEATVEVDPIVEDRLSQVESETLEAVTDPDGRFRFDGIGPGLFRLRVSARSEVLGVHWGVEWTGDRVVRIEPSQEHESRIALEGALLRTSVLLPGGEPAAGARVTVDGLGLTADAHGRCRVLVPVGKPVRVHAALSGWRGSSLKLESVQDDTSVRLQLGASTPTGRLVLWPSADVGAMGVGFFRKGALYPRMARNLYRRGDDPFELEIEAGNWIVEARPGGPWVGFSGTFIPFRAELLVEENKTHRLDVPVLVGARLRLAIVDSGGRSIDAECTLHDGAERRVPVQYMARGTAGLELRTDRVPAAPVVTIHPVLPGGRYRLEVLAHGRLVERWIDLVDGAEHFERIVVE